MLALWRWPCALIALLLSGVGGLRSLPADERSSDEAERVVVSRPAADGIVAGVMQTAVAGDVTVVPWALDAGTASETAAPTPSAWRPATCQRRGSAGGARAP